jgi:hypothetical protein
MWIVLWVGVFDLLLACSGNVWYGTRPIEGEERYVKVVATTESEHNDSPASRLAHPMVLPEADWARMLGDIYVRPRRRWITFGRTNPDPIIAFSVGDQQYLAHQLSKAFSQVKPSEWVIFYLAHPHEPDVTEITSGAFFAHNGYLHLLIANYRYAVTVPLLQQQIRDRPLRPKGESFFEFFPRDKQSVAKEHTWDLPKPPMAEFRELLVQIDESHSPIAGTRPEHNFSKDTMPNSGEPATFLEERLRTLDRLLSQGLITKEEYKLKRQKLLDEL